MVELGAWPHSPLIVQKIMHLNAKAGLLGLGMSQGFQGEMSAIVAQ